METVLITGGTGLLGKALTKALLDKGYAVIVLTRESQFAMGSRQWAIGSRQWAIGNGQLASGRISYAQWDLKKQLIDSSAISRADHVIHLAGASLAEKRWTAKRKKEIVDSRVKSGELLVKAMQETPNKVKTVISASGIGWYGADSMIPNPQPFKETDPSANNFVGQICQQWEDSMEPVKEQGKRFVKFRIGVVLSREGGALNEFMKPIKFGIAAILGSGKQVISWIHIDDIVGLFITAIENKQLDGIYNAVTPFPVSNKALTIELAKQKRGKWFIPVHVPSFAVKLIVGEFSSEVLNSSTVSCEKIQHSGFVFKYPAIKDALRQLFANP
ncbi:MAG TPA: TIGR01777 family oxidoreductase [Chitinophagaceae bacterium]